MLNRCYLTFIPTPLCCHSACFPSLRLTLFTINYSNNEAFILPISQSEANYVLNKLIVLQTTLWCRQSLRCVSLKRSSFLCGNRHRFAPIKTCFFLHLSGFFKRSVCPISLMTQAPLIVCLSLRWGNDWLGKYYSWQRTWLKWKDQAFQIARVFVVSSYRTNQRAAIPPYLPWCDTGGCKETKGCSFGWVLQESRSGCLGRTSRSKLLPKGASLLAFWEVFNYARNLCSEKDRFPGFG